MFSRADINKFLFDFIVIAVFNYLMLLNCLNSDEFFIANIAAYRQKMGIFDKCPNALIRPFDECLKLAKVNLSEIFMPLAVPKRTINRTRRFVRRKKRRMLSINGAEFLISVIVKVRHMQSIVWHFSRGGNLEAVCG